MLVYNLFLRNSFKLQEASTLGAHVSEHSALSLYKVVRSVKLNETTGIQHEKAVVVNDCHKPVCNFQIIESKKH